jgi:hypothetical protein
VITKDISKEHKPLPIKQKQPKEAPTKNDVNPIDDIFLSADKAMEEKQNEAVMQFRKKHRKHPILRSLIILLIIVGMVVGIIISVGVYSTKTIFPEIKQSFISEWALQQEELLKMDDSTLTIEEYYQKQIFLLITPEELEYIIDSVVDIKNLENLLDKDMDQSLIPPEKIEEYHRLLAEYEQAMADQEAGKEVTLPGQNETQPNEASD